MEPELPADLLFEDSVEDWQLISGHVVQPDYIDFKKSESGFAYGLVSQLRAGSYEPKPSLEIVNCVSIVVYVTWASLTFEMHANLLQNIARIANAVQCRN